MNTYDRLVTHKLTITKPILPAALYTLVPLGFTYRVLGPSRFLGAMMFSEYANLKSLCEIPYVRTVDGVLLCGDAHNQQCNDARGGGV